MIHEKINCFSRCVVVELCAKKYYNTILYFFCNSRGLRFYQSLEKTLSKLEEKIKEYRGNRKNEMAKLEEKAKQAKQAKGNLFTQFALTKGSNLFTLWLINYFSVLRCSPTQHFISTRKH